MKAEPLLCCVDLRSQLKLSDFWLQARTEIIGCYHDLFFIMQEITRTKTVST